MWLAGTVLMEAVQVLALVTTNQNYCPGENWFTRTSDDLWLPALPARETSADPDHRPVVTYVPWDVVRENTTNWKDTTNRSYSNGLSLPILRCLPERKRCQAHTHLYGTLKSTVTHKALCVNVDGLCKALLVVHDEVSYCDCFSPSDYSRRKNDMDGTLNVINMTLLNECPQGPDKNNNGIDNTEIKIIVHETDTITPSRNSCLQIPEDTDTCRSQIIMNQWWELAVDVLVCVIVISFIVSVVLIIWKRLTKGNSQSSQSENIELESEETLMDCHEVTSFPLADKTT
ncbi:uncharacterized protein LOC121862550 [Homarus americanus]|uniref:Uncharacterized protein n=1 Tax=Homarus americanus TaxID=6706 RepID=A0A8J5N2H8_HOMAM|nr:uncharacterized protein LOC121862550 [Homarus americanus]XP_042216786.1 uncharacterized protein LOC121862550 [Homarus americanus]XP_042216788.1 uncharacterized protein LOC121862550 [Homarus americanus]XP_042216789.1 uncharacterized protein LOC121862550 [Homarus americanus]KAG7171981.1 hypothetical protein Hamer_G000939 [Homarus americanus]